MEESGTKQTPNWFFKKDDKNQLSIIFIIFFDKPFGACLVSDSSISNWNSFCNCANFNLNLSALDMKLKLYWLQDG